MSRKIIVLTMLISFIGVLFGQIPLFNDDFNAGSNGWTFVNGNATNKWVHGTAAVGNSTGALYVSSAAAGTPYPVHSYLNQPIANSSRVYVYRDLPPIPANAINITLTFDAICGGENLYDYFKVYLQPTSFEPIPKNGTIVGTHNSASDEYTENQLSIPGANPWFNQANGTNPNTWTNLSLLIPSEIAAGQARRLVFMWRNDHAEGTQPPAGIDNIIITYDELSPEPAAAHLVAPLDNSTNVFLNQTLQWSPTPEGVPPTGYKVFFGTVNPPTIMTDLGFTTIWTPLPSLIPNTTYFWKIVPYNIYGDALNCPVWSFTTSAQSLVQIGDGTITQQPAPWYPWWRYNYTQTIYMANEINRPSGSLITSIGYQHNGGRAESDSISIYMGYTNLYGFPPPSPTAWIPQNELTEVFAGTIATTTTPQWMDIVLDTPFPFDEAHNLVIAVLDNFNNPTLVNTSSFLGTTDTGNRTLYVRNDDNPYNLSALGIPNMATTFANTRLTFSDPPDGPIISTPARLDFGKITLLDTVILNLVVRNFGNQNLIISSINTPAEATISPSSSVTIPPSGFQSFTVMLTPTTIGQYNNYITINSNANNGVAKNVPLRANVYPPNTIYIGDEYSTTRVSHIPFEFIYRNSISQSIYLKQDIGLNRPVELTHIKYNLAASGNIPANTNISVYLANTQIDTFDDPESWIPFANFVQVYQGPMPPTTPGVNEINLPLSAPFGYVGNNLVVMTFKPTAANNYPNNLWQVTPAGAYRSMYILEDVNTLNVASIGNYVGTQYTYRPNISFTYQEEAFPRPINLTGQIENEEIILSWEPPYVNPANNRPCTGYKVFRNNIQIASFGQNVLTYTDTEILNNIQYSYHVTAVYSDGESNPSNIVIMMISTEVLQPPANLKYTVDNQANIHLSWNFGELLVDQNFEGSTLDGWTIVGQADDIWEITTQNAKEGYQSMKSVSSTIITNNWLISPTFTPVPNTFLNFWMAVTDQVTVGERLLVKVSTTGPNTGSFNDTLYDELIDNQEWKRISINLINYIGQPIHIAFQHNTFNTQSSILIDGVQVLKPIATPTYTPLGFRIYLNETQIHQTNNSTFSYIVNQPPMGINGYFVTALYEYGEESYPGNILYIDPLNAENDQPIIPHTTLLKGNYPNPFNPETTISFSMAKEASVKVDIYNIKGQKIITLLDEVKKPGEYNILWNGNDLAGKQTASGIYFYRMQTDDYTAIKRMILMK